MEVVFVTMHIVKTCLKEVKQSCSFTLWVILTGVLYSVLYSKKTKLKSLKGGQMTKPIIVMKICYKLLNVIQVVKKIFDK